MRCSQSLTANALAAELIEGCLDGAFWPADHGMTTVIRGDRQRLLRCNAGTNITAIGEHRGHRAAGRQIADELAALADQV